MCIEDVPAVGRPCGVLPVDAPQPPGSSSCGWYEPQMLAGLSRERPVREQRRTVGRYMPKFRFVDRYGHWHLVAAGHGQIRESESSVLRCRKINSAPIRNDSGKPLAEDRKRRGYSSAKAQAGGAPYSRNPSGQEPLGCCDHNRDHNKDQQNARHDRLARLLALNPVLFLLLLYPRPCPGNYQQVGCFVTAS